MIEDYKLLTNSDNLLKKKLIIWGAGKRGKELAQKISRHTKQIEFVDVDESKAGKCLDFPVNLPEKLMEYEWEEYAIVLSPDNAQVQKSILEVIKQMGFEEIDVYTQYAVWAAVSFLNYQKGFCAKNTDESEKLMNELSSVQKMQTQLLMTLFAEKSVFVYQSKKVGSSSIARSVRDLGVYAVHVHNFDIPFIQLEYIKSIIKRGSGKVISIVREPIARQISLLWHYWWGGVYQNYHSLAEIEAHFYAVPNEEDEFIWYLKEFEKALDINIYDYPFNKRTGYCVIEKDGISVLLLKMEKLNELEKTIGAFLEINNFKLEMYNVADSKPYKYAYQNYLENVKIPSEFFKYYYDNNKYMDYFYTEEEKKIFQERWKNHILDLEL